jgi:hypothetical protein
METIDEFIFKVMSNRKKLSTLFETKNNIKLV